MPVTALKLDNQGHVIDTTWDIERRDCSNQGNAGHGIETGLIIEDVDPQTLGSNQGNAGHGIETFEAP